MQNASMLQLTLKYRSLADIMRILKLDPAHVTQRVIV